jgi:glutathione reductase (NADPH)
MPGAEHAITSNEAFHLKELPASILIVGGGYIAVEFAGIFHGLGAETTLLYRGEKILRGFDEDLRDGLMAEMFKREIDLRVNADIAAIEKNWSDYTVTLKDGSTMEVECVMFATGRSPNTGSLGLEKAGVKLGEDGEVRSTGLALLGREHLCGWRRHGPGQPHPVAIREGHAFADTVFGNKRWSVSPT